MKVFTNPKSKVFHFLAKIIDLFFLNILFILTSLPLITLGTSLLALNTVTVKMVLNQDSGMIVPAYLVAFKDNIKRGCQLTSVLILGFGLILSCAYCLHFMKSISVLIGMTGFVLLLVIFTILLLYLFPYNARYQDGLFKSMKISLQVAALNWKKTFLILGYLATYCLLLTWNNILFALGTLLFLLAGFSTLSFCVCKQVIPIFKKYE